MKKYPLAVYTAHHGMEWNYDREAIDFSSLDACRFAFGRIPDFGLGEKGYEAVWRHGNLIFAMVCQCARKWDFRGRDAIYLAVTWVALEEAKTTDFEKLLGSAALSTVSADIQTHFHCDVDMPDSESIPICNVKSFRDIGRAVDFMPEGCGFKRMLGENQILHVAATRTWQQSFVATGGNKESRRECSEPEKCSSRPRSPSRDVDLLCRWLSIGLALLVAALILRPNLKPMELRIASAEARIEELYGDRCRFATKLENIAEGIADMQPAIENVNTLQAEIARLRQQLAAQESRIGGLLESIKWSYVKKHKFEPECLNMQHDGSPCFKQPRKNGDANEAEGYVPQPVQEQTIDGDEKSKRGNNHRRSW